MKIDDVVNFFESAELSSISLGLVRLSDCETVCDLKKMVGFHLEYVKTEKERFEPYLRRLVKLKKIIEDETNKH